MRYLLALLLPPVAILFCGKPVQAAINLVIYILGLATAVIGVGLGLILVCIIHAMMVVSSHLADKRSSELVKAVASRPK